MPKKEAKSSGFKGAIAEYKKLPVWGKAAVWVTILAVIAFAIYEYKRSKTVASAVGANPGSLPPTNFAATPTGDIGTTVTSGTTGTVATGLPPGGSSTGSPLAPFTAWIRQFTGNDLPSINYDTAHRSQGIPIRDAPGGTQIGYLPFGSSQQLVGSQITGPSNFPDSRIGSTTGWYKLANGGYVSTYDLRLGGTGGGPMTQSLMSDSMVYHQSSVPHVSSMRG